LSNCSSVSQQKAIRNSL